MADGKYIQPRRITEFQSRSRDFLVGGISRIARITKGAIRFQSRSGDFLVGGEVAALPRLAR